MSTSPRHESFEQSILDAPDDEALRLKAERPDALPIQGGTDVMVALNFDRTRPLTVLNLNEVAELRGTGLDDAREELQAAGAKLAESAGDGYWSSR